MDWEEVKTKLTHLSAEKRQEVFEEFGLAEDYDLQKLWNEFVADSMKPLFRQLDEQLDDFEKEMEGLI